MIGVDNARKIKKMLLMQWWTLMVFNEHKKQKEKKEKMYKHITLYLGRRWDATRRESRDHKSGKSVWYAHCTYHTLTHAHSHREAEALYTSRIDKPHNLKTSPRYAYRGRHLHQLSSSATTTNSLATLVRERIIILLLQQRHKVKRETTVDRASVEVRFRTTRVWCIIVIRVHPGPSSWIYVIYVSRVRNWIHQEINGPACSVRSCVYIHTDIYED